MKKNGFTLVELIAIVALIALFSMIVFPNILKIQKSSDDFEYNEFLDTLFLATETYIYNDEDELNKIKQNGYDIIYINNLIESNLIESNYKNPKTEENALGYIIVTSDETEYKYEYLEYENSSNLLNYDLSTIKNIDNKLNWENKSCNINGGILKNEYLTLDGTDDWIECPEITYDKFTLEIIFSLNTLNNNKIDILNNGKLEIYVSDGKLVVNNNNEIIKTQYIINTDEINTITISYNSDSTNLYINGNKIDDYSIEQIDNSKEETNKMLIGINTDTEKKYANLNLYNIRVYNLNLTDEEIINNNLIDKKIYNKKD